MKKSWLVVQSRSGRELAIGKTLNSLSIPAFIPCYEKKTFGEYFRRTLIRPLFLNYFFVDLSYDELRAQASKALGVFGKLERIGTVENSFVEAIQARVGVSGFVLLNDDIQVGSEVTITESGPFFGRSGILSRRLSDGQRVQILLDAVAGKFSIEVSNNHIRPLELSVA